MVLSRKQCRMLLSIAERYESRHGRNATNGDHRAAKLGLEQFLAVPANKTYPILRSRDFSWFQEWLGSRDMHGESDLWQALHTQIEFATY